MLVVYPKKRKKKRATMAIYMPCCPSFRTCSASGSIRSSFDFFFKETIKLL